MNGKRSRRLVAAVSSLLIVAGLALIAAAAIAVSLPLGLLVGGLCCLVLAWCVDDGDTAERR